MKDFKYAEHSTCCPRCFNFFSSQEDLARHMKEIHRILPPGIQSLKALVLIAVAGLSVALTGCHRDPGRAASDPFGMTNKCEPNGEGYCSDFNPHHDR